MKVVINIDNDTIVAYTSLMGIKGEGKEKIKAYLAENESVEVEPSDIGDNEAEQGINLTCVALVLSKMKDNENN